MEELIQVRLNDVSERKKERNLSLNMIEKH